MDDLIDPYWHHLIPSWDYPETGSFPAALWLVRMRKTLRTEGHVTLIALLKEQRLRAGLTQQQVADALGVPQSFVAKYEGGERRLDVVEFIEAAGALGLDPSKLFERVVIVLAAGK